jgi:predicted lactoylglutathione lyase
MIAIKLTDFHEVEIVHAKAIELGGKDEGAPGPRGEHGFMGAYFRDLDGNKLNAYVPGT